MTKEEAQSAQDRAQVLAQELAKRCGAAHWTDCIDDVLTDEQKAYIMQVWQTMPGYTRWFDAFEKIRRGDLVSLSGQPCAGHRRLKTLDTVLTGFRFFSSAPIGRKKG